MISCIVRHFNTFRPQYPSFGKANTTTMHTIATELKEQCIIRIEENLPRITKCLHELTEEELWQRPNPNVVSIANLVLHLCGNIRQYAISSLCHEEDTRHRDQEFSATGGYTRQELLDKLSATVTGAVNVIMNASDEELMRQRNVQGFQMSGIGIIVHVTEHLSYHTGQVALHTKLIRQKDLGFYAGIDLSVTNTPHS